MGKIQMKVTTVPAMDPVTFEKHTTFCVSVQTDGLLLHAPGWTLQDAIELFCRWYSFERNQIVLLRPFLPQRMTNGEEDN